MIARQTKYDRTVIRNRILRALPEAEIMDIWNVLERVPLRHRQTLLEPDVPIREVYFIESGTACVISRSDHHRIVELGIIGRMGLVGVPTVLGAERSTFRCFVQIPGEALRCEVAQFRQAMQEHPVFRQLLLAYVHVLMTMQGQNVVCGIRHSVRQRVARWLLMALDRLEGIEIPVTHELIARMLGARRASVTEAIAELEGVRAIQRGRGHVTVVDRACLENLSCECYASIRNDFDRLLQPRPRAAPIVRDKLQAFTAAFHLAKE